MKAPQHWEEEVQWPPWPTQFPSLQVPVESQARAPQHCEEEVQCRPLSRQLPSEQTPELQVRVPQQSEDEAQWEPLPRQVPSVHILLELQVRTPQQSPEELQCPPFCSQGTMVSPGREECEDSPMSQARDESAAASARRRVRGARMGVSIEDRRGPHKGQRA